MAIDCDNVGFITSESGACGSPEQPLGSLVSVEEDGERAVVECQDGWLAGGDKERNILTCNKGRWEGAEAPESCSLTLQEKQKDGNIYNSQI